MPCGSIFTGRRFAAIAMVRGTMVGMMYSSIISLCVVVSFSSSSVFIVVYNSAVSAGFIWRFSIVRINGARMRSRRLEVLMGKCWLNVAALRMNSLRACL